MILAKAQALLAIVAASVMALSAEAASSQKSYVNDRFGFAFDYPAAWAVLEKQSDDAVLNLKLLTPQDDVPVLRDYVPGSFSIDVFANSARKPLREWLDEHGWPFTAAGRSVTATTLGGLPALEVSTGQMLAPNRFFYVAHEEWVFRVSALAADSTGVVQSLRFKR